MGLIYFLLLLGGLVFFHEFGHFIVARMCGVRVLTFSLGFGPGATVYKSPRSGTEYRLCVLPLGGYVKMLGDDPTEDMDAASSPDAFGNKALWKRTLIVAAGPVFNLVLPIFIFFFLGFFAPDLPPSEVGMVMHQGPAWEAGLREGDRITAIDGEEIQYWWQLNAKISKAPNKVMELDLARGDEQLKAVITPKLYSELRIPELGLKEERGQIRIGAEHVKPILGARLEGNAAEAGIQNWDWVIEVNGKPVSRFSEVRNALESKEGSVELTVVRKSDWFDEDMTALPELAGAPTSKMVLQSPGGKKALAKLGLSSAELTVHEVDENSPATSLRACATSCSEDTDCSVGYVCGSVEGQNVCTTRCTKDKECVGGGFCQQGVCKSPLPPLQNNRLQPGDRIIAHNGKVMQRWHHLSRALYEHPESVHQIHVQRGAVDRYAACFIPEKKTIKNEFNTEENRVVLGVSHLSFLDLPPRVPNESRLAYAMHRAIWDTWDALKINLYAVAGLFVGNVPMNQLGGPIFIGQLAAKTQERGYKWFFGIMVMLSINLGLLNLLPVPMLDGGHLFFFAIEAVTRRPISVRVRQMAAYVGLSFIFLLMIMVFKNDLERLLGGM